MTPPLLSIAIPTYNRRELLRQTLAAVLAQKTPEVEILVCDNCSTDDTWDYLASLGDQVTAFRQATNVGADPNFLSCLARSSGRYVWTLCDDDLPCVNAVESVLAAIRADDSPAALFLSARPADKLVSGYDAAPVSCGWTRYDRDGFLRAVGVWFTFGSSIVVRRDAPDAAFLKEQTGSLLIPAAIMLSSVGRANAVLVSDEPLLYARGDNTGGYNGLIIFTRNLSRLLQSSRSLGYRRPSLDAAYGDALDTVITLIVRSWAINPAGLLTLARYSYRYRSFYTRVVPALARRAARSARGAVRARLGRSLARA